MSRRSVTTIRVSVQLRLPPGVKPGEGVQYVKSAVAQQASCLSAESPLRGLAITEILVKLESKQTVYL